MIENTTNRDPLLHVLGALDNRDDPSAYITGMEAAGQQQLVHSDQIPVDAADDELRALGFVLGDPTPGDDLFRSCTLPAGWSKQASDHAMHSYIVDELGRQRVAIFYKAAFYDRRADATVIHLRDFLRSCAGGYEELVLDGTWATRDTVLAAIDVETQSLRLGLERYPTSVHRKEAIARLDALRARLDEPDRQP